MKKIAVEILLIGLIFIAAYSCSPILMPINPETENNSPESGGAVSGNDGNEGESHPTDGFGLKPFTLNGTVGDDGGIYIDLRSLVVEVPKGPVETTRSVSGGTPSFYEDNSLINYAELYIVDQQDPKVIYNRDANDFSDLTAKPGLGVDTNSGCTYGILVLLGNKEAPASNPTLLYSGYKQQVPTRNSPLTWTMEPVVLETEVILPSRESRQVGRLAKTVGLEAGTSEFYLRVKFGTNVQAALGNDSLQEVTGNGLVHLKAAQDFVTHSVVTPPANSIKMVSNKAFFVRPTTTTPDTIASNLETADYLATTTADSIAAPSGSGSPQADYMFSGYSSLMASDANRGKVYVNAVYLPFGFTGKDAWAASQYFTTGLSTAPINDADGAAWTDGAYTGTADPYPVWIIRNGLNDNAQTVGAGNTDYTYSTNTGSIYSFGSGGNHNGAISVGVVVSTGSTTGVGEASLYEDNNPWPVCSGTLAECISRLDAAIGANSGAGYGKYVIKVAQSCTVDSIQFIDDSATSDPSSNQFANLSQRYLKSGPLTITSDIPVTLTLGNYDVNGTNACSMFYLSENSNMRLALKGNLTLVADVLTGALSPVPCGDSEGTLRILGGTVEMYDQVKITSLTGGTPATAPAVSMWLGGNFTMYGGEISNIIANEYDGAGVSNAGSGVFIMYGGKIGKNKSNKNIWADQIKPNPNDYWPAGTIAWVDVDGDGPLPPEQLTDGSVNVIMASSGRELYTLPDGTNVKWYRYDKGEDAVQGYSSGDGRSLPDMVIWTEAGYRPFTPNTATIGGVLFYNGGNEGNTASYTEDSTVGTMSINGVSGKGQTTVTDSSGNVLLSASANPLYVFKCWRLYNPATGLWTNHTIAAGSPLRLMANQTVSAVFEAAAASVYEAGGNTRYGSYASFDEAWKAAMDDASLTDPVIKLHKDDVIQSRYKSSGANAGSDVKYIKKNVTIQAYPVINGVYISTEEVTLYRGKDMTGDLFYADAASGALTLTLGNANDAALPMLRINGGYRPNGTDPDSSLTVWSTGAWGTAGKINNKATFSSENAAGRLVNMTGASGAKHSFALKGGASLEYNRNNSNNPIAYFKYADAAMTGGYIRYNYTLGGSGGIHLENPSTFTMSGGEICYNRGGTASTESYQSAPVFVNNYSEFILNNGGKIHHNTFSIAGAAVANRSTITMNGGLVYNNHSTNTQLGKNNGGQSGSSLSYGAGAFLGHLDSTGSPITALIEIKGGSIYGNKADATFIGGAVTMMNGRDDGTSMTTLRIRNGAYIAGPPSAAGSANDVNGWPANISVGSQQAGSVLSATGKGSKTNQNQIPIDFPDGYRAGQGAGAGQDAPYSTFINSYSFTALPIWGGIGAAPSP